MCEVCEATDALLTEVNEGGREMDATTATELVTKIVQQMQIPLAEALADLDGSDRGQTGEGVRHSVQHVSLVTLSQASGHNAAQVMRMAVLLRIKKVRSN